MDSCSDVHSHEPYELTNLKVKQTNNGVLANVVIDSDDEGDGDKTDDELQGNSKDSTPVKAKLGESLFLPLSLCRMFKVEFACLKYNCKSVHTVRLIFVSY